MSLLGISLNWTVLYILVVALLALQLWRIFYGQPGTNTGQRMSVLEYLDRVGQRRADRVYRPWDIRQFIGCMFLAGYYIMVYQFATRGLPAENIGLIRDAMLTLGPPVGLIVGAMFRSDANQEQATRNTGEAMRTIRKAVEVGTGEAKPDVTLDPGEIAQAKPTAP